MAGVQGSGGSNPRTDGTDGLPGEGGEGRPAALCRMAAQIGPPTDGRDHREEREDQELILPAEIREDQQDQPDDAGGHTHPEEDGAGLPRRCAAAAPGTLALRGRLPPAASVVATAARRRTRPTEGFLDDLRHAADGADDAAGLERQEQDLLIGRVGELAERVHNVAVE